MLSLHRRSQNDPALTQNREDKVKCIRVKYMSTYF